MCTPTCMCVTYKYEGYFLNLRVFLFLSTHRNHLSLQNGVAPLRGRGGVWGHGVACFMPTSSRISLKRLLKVICKTPGLQHPSDTLWAVFSARNWCCSEVSSLLHFAALHLLLPEPAPTPVLCLWGSPVERMRSILVPCPAPGGAGCQGGAALLTWAELAEVRQRLFHTSVLPDAVPARCCKLNAEISQIVTLHHHHTFCLCVRGRFRSHQCASHRVQLREVKPVPRSVRG